MVPDIEVETVPVPANNEFGGDSDAPNMVRNFKLEFHLQRLLIALLNHCTAVPFVLGNRQPHGGLIRGETSWVEPISVLYLDRSQEITGCPRKLLEIAFTSGGVNR